MHEDGSSIISEGWRIPETNSPKPDLATLLSSEKWQQLTPNFVKHDALLPKDMNTALIESVIGTLSSPDIIRRFQRRDPITEPLTITDIGILELLGVGDSKQVFRLTTQANKHLAILVDRGYALGVVLPEDKRIYDRAELATEERPAKISTVYATYSDLRTYLSVPLTITPERYGGVYFQEYGGQHHLSRLAMPFTHPKEERGVRSYVSAKGWEIVDPQEIQDEDHYLLPDGRGKKDIAVIDIPLRKYLTR